MNRTQHKQSICRWQHSLSVAAYLCRSAFSVPVQKMRPVGFKAPLNT